MASAGTGGDESADAGGDAVPATSRFYTVDVAAYDYRCRMCDTRFEVRRGVSESAGDVRCPSGHRDVARVWSAIAVGTRTSVAAPTQAGPSGGCCGGGCCN